MMTHRPAKECTLGRERERERRKEAQWAKGRER